MNYNWNILTWINNMLPVRLQKPNRIGIIATLIANIKQSTGTDNTLYNQFVEFMLYCRLRTRYNIQQGSLQALLNKIFDPSLNRIYLVTTSDIIVTPYGQDAEENTEVVYGKEAGDSFETAYAYTDEDYENAYDGYVYIPAELEPKEAEIRTWIDYNIFLSKRYRINYF